MESRVNLYETRAERIAYLEGLIEGIWRFAYWKDGVQHVGSCGTRYADAVMKHRLELERIKREETD